jgi:hypothetical protein
MTEYAAYITWAISLLALVVSVVSLRRTGPLHRIQTELATLQTERLKQAPRADVRVALIDTGNRSYKFAITNQGDVPARAVTFEVSPLEERWHSPLVEGDYDKKLPIPELAPGSDVLLIAAISSGTGITFNARWSWRNPDDKTETRQTMIGL